MSDNVGLPTPRGSGTSGYIQRNLAHMKPRDLAPYPPRDNDRQHRPRQPDKGLLEHERKREVEVKVFELRDRLEEEGVEEDEIEARCDELRKKLLAEMERGGGANAGPTRKTFKMHQVHELADAKIKESERLRQALKISKDYEEGSHWRRQEEKLKKSLEQQEAGGEKRAEKERDRSRERERRRDPSRDRNRSRSPSRSRSQSRNRGRDRYKDRTGRGRDRSWERDRSEDRSRSRGRYSSSERSRSPSRSQSRERDRYRDRD
ncbi:hypothetical protein VTJ83DRAFT_2595 [Remersonia thermophila]|uniref:CWF21 domain-containing protein n=1 Tax=Remersonia thermophila TaxID=72144 RepID=A0ABR4DKN4_9PEZI